MDREQLTPDALIHEAVEEACKNNPRLVLEPYYQMKAAARLLAEQVIALRKCMDGN